MAETVYYGLQKLGPSDALTTNDFSFTWFNIDTIDRLLYKINRAFFDQNRPIENPATGPTLTVSPEGGTIPASTTVRYKYTFVDVYGNETAGSPETVITTPAQVDAPNAPGISYAEFLPDNVTPAGTLTFGTYFYALSAYVGVDSHETLTTSPAFVSILGTSTTNAITLTLPSLPAGASGFVVYKRGPGQSIYYYLDTIDMMVATPPSTYSDNGSVSQNISRSPSNVNTTNASNSITVTVPDEEVPVGYTWKIYRTYTTSYDSSFLNWVTEETTLGSGIIMPSYVDVGNGTNLGHPPSRSLIFGEALANLSGGSQILDYNNMDEDPLPVTWDTVTAGSSTVASEGTFYRLIAAPGTGTAQQTYITKTLNFKFGRVYSIGAKFTFDQGPLSSGQYVKLMNIGNTTWDLNLYLYADSIDGTARYKASLVVDGFEQYLNMPLNTMPYTNAAQTFQKVPILNNVDRIDTVPQYLHIILDLDAESHFVTKPNIQIFINGVLTMYGDLDTSSTLIPDVGANVTDLAVGLLGYVGPFSNSSTQANNFAMLVDYVYTEELPSFGREFNQIRAGDFSHTQIYKAHPQYEAVTKQYLPAASTRTSTTLIADSTLSLLPVSNRSPFVEFQGCFRYAARTTEDIKFKITLDYNTATPWTSSSVEYSIQEFANITSGAAGKVYTQSDTVVLQCAGESSYNMLHIHGWILNSPPAFPASNLGTMYLTVYWAKNANDGSPGTATLAKGSYIKIIDQDAA